MIVMSGLSAILVLAFWIPARDNASIIAFTVLYGFSSGGFVSLPPALIAQISDVREIGTRTGTLLATAAIGTLTGNPIGGALVPDVAHGDYWHMQLFAGLMMAVGTVLFLFARVSAVGWGLMRKF
jgi:MFS family permease